MQSHEDDTLSRAEQAVFMERLKERAGKMQEAEKSVIAGGSPGEPELAS